MHKDSNGKVLRVGQTVTSVLGPLTGKVIRFVEPGPRATDGQVVIRWSTGRDSRVWAHSLVGEMARTIVVAGQAMTERAAMVSAIQILARERDEAMVRGNEALATVLYTTLTDLVARMNALPAACE